MAVSYQTRQPRAIGTASLLVKLCRRNLGRFLGADDAMTDARDPPSCEAVPGEDVPDESVPDESVREAGAWRAFLDRTLGPLVPV